MAVSSKSEPINQDKILTNIGQQKKVSHLSRDSFFGMPTYREDI